jgi:iron complex outermembrane receptor protein
MSLQAYYQYEDRNDPLYIVDAESFDLDFQHNFALTDHQEIVWGLGYRRNQDDFTDTEFSKVRPNRGYHPTI